MSGSARILRLWDFIHEATQVVGVQSLHLAAGRPPMVRVQDEGLRPLSDAHASLTPNDMMVMLSIVVEPQRWDSLEAIGDGEIILARGSDRPMTLNLFKSSETWSAVVHL